MLKYFGIFVLLAIATSSCGDANVIFQETKEIPEESWNKDYPVSFDFEIDDTTRLHDFYFNLRTTSSYEWYNLFVFVEIIAPNELFNIDTVEFVFSNKK